MRLRVLFHGHCFDGLASAAVFTRFYREVRPGGGGHAVVGAISLGPSEIESARAAAREIVGELSHV